MDNDRTDADVSETKACDGRLDRKEFLAMLMRRAVMAGALVAAPGVVDKFLIPPAEARASTLHVHDTSHSSDTNHFHDKQKCTSPFHDQTSHFHDKGVTNPFHDGNTSPFHDCIDEGGDNDDFG